MKTLLNIKLHLSKKNIFTILVFILVLGGTTGCIQHKSDQKRLPALSFTVNGESFEMIPVEGGTFIMGGTSEVHLPFSAGSCEVVVGVVLQKAAECHILTMTCQTIVMNMEVLGLF